MGTFAENLRYYREKAELSQKELAKAIGVSVAAYNKYETRGNEPKIDILIKLAKALNIDVNTLVGFRQTPEEILIDYEEQCPEYFNIMQILYMGFISEDDVWKIIFPGEDGGSFPVPSAELESMITACHKQATSETSKIFQTLKKTESEYFFTLLSVKLLEYYHANIYKPGSMTTEPQTDSAETTDNK